MMQSNRGAAQYRAVLSLSTPGHRSSVSAGRINVAAWASRRVFAGPRARSGVFSAAGFPSTTSTAIDAYARIEDTWAHADPELQPAVTEARAALTRLASDKR